MGRALTPKITSRFRALTGSTNADTSNHALEAGNYAKITARGNGLVHFFVSQPPYLQYVNTMKDVVLSIG